MRIWQAGQTYAVFSNPANKKIIAEIEGAGAETISFPTPEIETVVLNAASENSLENLSSFDWIIFPDVFAVDYFLQALEQSGIDFYELDALRVCAFGETVSDRLRYAQIHSDVISKTIESERVFQSLLDYEPNLDELNFLLVREFQTAPEIAARLRESGASVAEIPVYQARIREISVLPKLKALLKGGAIDEFVFCSPDEIASLAIIFRPENVFRLLSGIEIGATDAAAYQSLREYGFAKIKMR